jgi:NADP-dependent 3-hydroxy acid dehydrogenase YdfG
MNETALITGATSGIGEATARKLAALGYRLIITGRRNDRLERLRHEIKKNHSVEVLPLNFDIRDNEATRKALDSLPPNWRTIDILVNNAGLASGLAPIHEGKWENWEQMIDTNIKGLLFISRYIIPSMVERKSGHIINISSIAGIETYENGNVYCATKHAVNAITKGMRIDLLKHHIKVSSISPGAVETEFSVVRFEGDKNKADKVYEGLNPLLAEDIADAVEFIVTRPPHVNINDMLIMPTQQASAVNMVRE